MTQNVVELSELGISLRENVYSKVIREQNEGRDHKVQKTKFLMSRTRTVMEWHQRDRN